ncbi:MAG: thiosulfate oxidation carrier complex protein SoxZ [Rubrimonas sp.]
MSTPKPRVRIQKTATPGEVVLIKTLISHDMESGQRRDKDGAVIPRKIINRFACTFNGQEVFAMDVDPAVSANPYIEFTARVDESGVFDFTWVDDDGSIYQTQEEISVG